MATRPFYLEQLKGLGSVLTLAAEQSMVVGTTGMETVVDVLHGRALRHYAEGLRQHLTVQTGEVGAGAALLRRLRATAAAVKSEELLKEPGVRARLYRIAEELIAMHREVGGAEPTGAALRALPWRNHPTSRVPREALDALRFELDARDRLVLELRFARELSADELAFALDLRAEEALVRLDEAMGRADALLRAHRTGSKPFELERAVLEAFALDSSEIARRADRETEGWDPLPAGTVVGGRYAVDERVGTGAFGDVYRASDTEVPGHVVALKLLHQPSLSERSRQNALRELRLIASVFHPSIVQFKDHGWHEDRLWFVMPWYEGETLEARISRAPLSRAEALRIFRPLSQALAAMHAVGVRHQDVKPDNILLARIPGVDGEDLLPVLLDLGVAAKDAEMIFAGTPTYFAPEVAAQFASTPDKPLVSHRADVFALALALRNALDPETQEDVPGGAVASFIEARSREVPPPPTRREHRYLASTFRRWLSVDPAERPSAAELAAELDVLTAPEQRRAKRRALLSWAVPLVALFGIVLTVSVMTLRHRAVVQQVEAERARLTADQLRRDLQDSHATSRQLEAKAEALRMTREQLAARLEQSLSALGAANDGLDKTTQRLRQTEDARDALLKRADKLDATLTATRTEATNLQTRLESTRQALAAAQDQLAAAHDDAVSMRGQLAALDARLTAESAKADQLERSVSSVLEDKAKLEDALQQSAAALEQAKADAANARRDAEAARREAAQARVKASPQASAAGTASAPGPTLSAPADAS
ncbi:MAG: protein kinase [Myxococcales bacterium]|nr:protein kinase [Myxococcales bacterium]